MYLTDFIREEGIDLNEYDNLCGEFTNDFSKWLDSCGIRHRLLHIEATGNERLVSKDSAVWSFHSVVMIDHIVHDPWYGDSIPLSEYVKKMFRNDYVIVEFRS